MSKSIKKGDSVRSLTDKNLKGKVIFMSMVDSYEAYVLWDGHATGEFVKTYLIEKIDPKE